MGKYEESFRSVIRSESEAIARMEQELDYEVMEQIADIFLHIKERRTKVILAGCGTAGKAAARIAHTLCVVEIPAIFLSPADAVHGGMGVMQEGDVLVLISKSGNTREILDYLPAAKAKGLTVIGVTENPESGLGRAADITLLIRVEREPDPWGIISSASTLAVISAFDAIALTVMQYNGFNKEQFYLIHTGGGVGDILRAEGMGKGQQ